MMRPNEIRNLTLEEIGVELQKRREVLLNLRLQSSVRQLNNTKEIRTNKREVARLLTIAREISLAQEEA